jgi:tetratricopeptide (TPR) repeat protein
MRLKKSSQHFLPAGICLFALVVAGCSTHEQLLVSQGEEQLKELRYAEPYETFTRYVALDSTSSFGYYNRAIALVGLNRPSDALVDLDKALRLNAGNIDALWLRFRINARRREIVRDDTAASLSQRPMKQIMESTLKVLMLEDLDAVLRIDRTDVLALNERGRLKHERGDYEAALADYDAALVVCDTCSWLLYNKALTLKASWRGREAIPLLEKVIRADSSDGEAWLLLGECYFGLGRREDACYAFRRSMQLGVAEAEDRINELCH